MAAKLKKDERACPKCKEAIKVDASVCKHCGAEFTSDEVAAAKAAADAENIQNMKYGAVGCLGLVFLLGLCSYAVGGSEDGGSSAANKSAPTTPGKPAASAKADAIVFYKGIMGAIRPCDEAGQKVASAGSTGDLVGVYRAADAMESACLSVASDIRAIDVPESVGEEAHAKLTETREVCENTYVQRWSAAGKMKKVLDENGAIGRQAELKDTMELVEAGTLACAAGLVGQVMSLGVTEAELDSGKAT